MTEQKLHNLIDKNLTQQGPKDRINGLELREVEHAMATELGSVNNQLENKANKSDISNIVGGMINKGRVDNVSELPSNALKGDSYIVENEKNEYGNSYIYQWDGNQWNNTGLASFPENVANKSVEKVVKNYTVFSPDAKSTRLLDFISFIKDIKVVGTTLITNENTYYLVSFRLLNYGKYQFEIKNSAGTLVFFNYDIDITIPEDDTEYNHSFTIANKNTNYKGSVIVTVNWGNYIDISTADTSIEKTKLNNNIIFAKPLSEDIAKNTAEIEILKKNAKNNSVFTSNAKGEVVLASNFIRNIKIISSNVLTKDKNLYLVSFKKNDIGLYQIEIGDGVTSPQLFFSYDLLKNHNIPATSSPDYYHDTFQYTQKEPTKNTTIELTVNWAEFVNIAHTYSEKYYQLNNAILFDEDNNGNGGDKYDSAFFKFNSILNVSKNPITSTDDNALIANTGTSVNFKLTKPTAANAGIWTKPTNRIKLNPNSRYAFYLQYKTNAGTVVNVGQSIDIRLGTIIVKGLNTRFDGATDFGVIYYDGFIFNTPSTVNADYALDVVFNLRGTGIPEGYAWDVTFLNIMLVEIKDTDITITTLYDLFNQTGFFSGEMLLSKYAQTSLTDTSISRNCNMVTAGDSVTGMKMWQKFVAGAMGWNWDVDTIRGKDGHAAMGVGSTALEPIIYNTTYAAAGKNLYMRIKDAKYYHPDVLIILASYNGKHAGQAWVTGGAMQPADYGLNDAPYHGSEVDLLANPTASVPSFGASYYGMIENLLTDIPECRIVLMTLMENGLGGNSNPNNQMAIGKNEVIRKASETYHLEVIDLYKYAGFNNITLPTLAYNAGVHPNNAGGKRMAKYIISQL